MSSSRPKKPSKKKSSTPSSSSPPPPSNLFSGCYIPQPAPSQPQFQQHQYQQPQYQQFPQQLTASQQHINAMLAQAYANGWIPQSSPQTPYQNVPQSPFQSFSQEPLPSQMESPFPSPTQNVPETQFGSEPRRLAQSDSDEEDVQEVEEEVEEEIEESAPEKNASQWWKADEVRHLGEAWVDCSQQPQTGKNQTGDDFKRKVWQSWCNRLGYKSRNPGALYSKWRKCNRVAMEFQGIHNEVVRQNQSGTNSEDEMSKARKLYESTYATRFSLANEGFWRAVKDFEKWRQLDSFDHFALHIKTKKQRTSSTQSTSSDQSVHLDLNTPFDPPPPAGRDATKRKIREKGQASKQASNANSTSSNSSAHEDVASLMGNIEAFKEGQKHKDDRLQMRYKMQLNQILMEDISGLRGWERKAKEKMKKKAAMELGLYSGSDEDEDEQD